MIRRRIVLVTGANGEVGQGLIRRLADQADKPRILALDLKRLDRDLRPMVDQVVVGNILDDKLLETLGTEFEIEAIYHLAALLSTSSEFHPENAHRVNVQGTINLLRLSIDQSQARGDSVKFVYASSIAAYGLPNLDTKYAVGKVLEDQYLDPITMYGCNKLYCEHLGRYYARHYQQLSAHRMLGVDFRCVRFPGLISATTMPTGGTSDYAPEMLHAAAQDEPYRCFVREDTTIPFMAMPDAITALLRLAQTPRERLKRHVYNVTSFSRSAGQLAETVETAFPKAVISFEPSDARQSIVDSWPADLDDSAARDDWAWAPEFDVNRAFDDYLIPTISQRYK